ncbi:golgin subfamily A member 8S-like isoform X1 [Symphalangus syndactylus]|uniref:golgin subfamily A member 8S-like isoform X1 n=1 Tax=Symphalangus syndactylus TaxID=9590 RepID=UPI00300561E5
MWPQPYLPTHPTMAEETRQSKLAVAKTKFKEYWQRKSCRVTAGAKRNRKTNGSIPETATFGGCQSPGDSATGFHREGPTSSATLKDLESPCQEPAVVWDSRSVKVNELKNTIESLKQQNKDLEHQLEEEKKENKKRHQAEWGLKLQIAILDREKNELHTDLCRTKGVLRHFEEESKDLAGHLQCSSQCIGELERALSAVTTKQKKDISFSSRSRELSWWRLKKSTEEKARLKTQLTRLKQLLTQVQSERDQYVCQIEGERARWQQRMSKTSQEIDTLKKSKNHYTHRLEELQSKLKNLMAEPLPPEPPAVPSEMELQHLRKQLERVAGELQAQVEKNQRISLLNRVQEERLQKQEERLQEQQERLQLLAKSQSVFEELERLEATSQQNQQLTAQLGLMALPGEGDGGEPQPMPSVPEDLESREATVAFFKSTGASAQEEQARLREQISFMDHLEEKADLSELVKKQEIRFIQYWRERCHQKTHHLLTEPGRHAKDAALGGGDHEAGPGQGGDEGEAAGAAADGIGACGDDNNGHRKFLAAAQNPADEPGPGAPAPQELGAADKHGDLCEVSLTSSAQGEAREGPPCDNPTAQPIVRDHQEHPGLGSIGCLPFFCWAWLPRRRR